MSDSEFSQEDLQWLSVGQMAEKRLFNEAINLLDQVSSMPSTKLLYDPSFWRFLFNPSLLVSYELSTENYGKYAQKFLNFFINNLDNLNLTERFRVIESFLRGAEFRSLAHTEHYVLDIMKSRSFLITEYIKIAFPNIRANYFFNANNAQKKLCFLVKHFNNDPEILGLMGLLSPRNRRNYHLTVAVDREVGDSAILEDIKLNADEIIFLSDDFQETVTLLRAQCFDLVVILNDSTAKFTKFSLLANVKIAKKSAINLSNLFSTGSKYVNYYLSSPYYIKRGFQSEYTEEMIEIPAPGFSMTEPSLGDFKNFIEFDNPRKTILSLANFHKLNTKILNVYAEILSMHPSVELLFLPFPPHYGCDFEEDVANSIKQFFITRNIDPNRVKVLKSLGNRKEFLKFISKATLCVDSYPYPGVTTIADCFSVGLPVVAFEGIQLRNSQGANLLSSLGFDDFIANSEEDFINLVTKLLCDESLWISYKKRLFLFNELPNFLSRDVYTEQVNKVFDSILK